MDKAFVRDPSPADEPEWRRLWADYTAFYNARVAPEATAETWRRILDPHFPIFARMAQDERGALAGFAVCVLHAGTWTAEPVCYLEDLFVAPQARGRGVGRSLIEDLIAQCRGQGWRRLYWHTDRGNERARRLYDQFIEADDFVRYRLFLD